MFGWKKKQRQFEQQVKELEQRLEHNSKIIEEDHHDLAELKTLVVELKAHVERLHLEVGALRSRQQALRLALSEAMAEPIPIPKQTTQEADLSPFPTPANPGIKINHICVYPDTCIHCHPDLRNHD